ncbi:unnamed protein product [Lactuca saligna]|uniref:Uncharacterized protein n=1 Tax=Lactuca saligna TaxID=75948 RepID=A0AA35YSE3_LACSI|nr:unnamed protein product [Lactuca saligna]
MMNRVTRNEDDLRRRRCGGEKKLKGMLQWKWKPRFCGDRGLWWFVKEEEWELDTFQIGLIITENDLKDSGARCFVPNVCSGIRHSEVFMILFRSGCRLVGIRFRLEGLKVEEDALNLEFRGLNMEETLKDHELGLQLMPRRGLPIVTSWWPSGYMHFAWHVVVLHSPRRGTRIFPKTLPLTPLSPQPIYSVKLVLHRCLS